MKGQSNKYFYLKIVVSLPWTTTTSHVKCTNVRICFLVLYRNCFDRSGISFLNTVVYIYFSSLLPLVWALKTSCRYYHARCYYANLTSSSSSWTNRIITKCYIVVACKRILNGNIAFSFFLWGFNCHLSRTIMPSRRQSCVLSSYNKA